MTAQLADETPLVGERAVLSGGIPVRVRPIAAGDAERLIEFHEGLSGDTVYLRYFNVHPHLSPLEVERFTHVDGSARMGLVALDGSRIIGMACYDLLIDAPSDSGPRTTGAGTGAGTRSSGAAGSSRVGWCASGWGTAEVSFVVADEYQGHGLASMLLHRLAALAVGVGIGTFSATTMIENHAMQEVFRHSGFPHRGSYRNGLVEYLLDIRPQ